FTDDELKAFNGPPLVDTFKNLIADLADEMVQTYRKHNLANHDQYVKVFPDVLETIEHLYKRNVPMGVVSAKMRRGVELGLELNGLIDFFQTIVAVDVVIHAKPHNELVLRELVV